MEEREPVIEELCASYLPTREDYCDYKTAACHAACRPREALALRVSGIALVLLGILFWALWGRTGYVQTIADCLLVLLGVGADDTDEDVEYLAGKLVRLRIFDDAQGVMNLDVRQVGGQVLVVSQFTLLASTRKGNRPSYIKAAPEAVSRPMYERFAARVAELLGREVMTGEFGADMQVALVNDGPVTIWIDSKMRDC